MMRLAAALLVALSFSVARAQVSTGATPIFHGLLDIRPARGTIDPSSGTALVTVRNWRFLLTTRSNGIFPAEEPVIVAIGENNYMLPAGALLASKNGKTFSYRAPRGGSQALRSIRLKLRKDGAYGVRFTVQGVDLSKLVLEDPVCLPTAVLVGDDDGFSGVEYTRRNFNSKRVRVSRACEIDTWPWA